LIPTLVLKHYYAERLETGVTPDQLASLTHISRAFDDRLNRAPARQAPYVGASAFATKAGIHASALLKDFSTYEHVPPESVGNERSIMVSQQAGKSNLLTALARHNIVLEKDDPRLEKLLAEHTARAALRKQAAQLEADYGCTDPEAYAQQMQALRGLALRVPADAYAGHGGVARHLVAGDVVRGDVEPAEQDHEAEQQPHDDRGSSLVAGLAVGTLLNKPVRRLVDIPLRYVGFELPDEFVVGYGLDFRGRYRNLPFIATLRPEILLAA